MNFEKIFAVIVNWNLKDDTIACLRSLLKAGLFARNIVLVDNGSRDNIVSGIQTVYPDITIIKNKQNFGFAVANNIGITYALEQSAEWVFLLNNDTIVAPNILAEIQRVHRSTQASVYGPQIRYFDEPERIWYLGDIHIPGTLFTRSLQKDRLASVTLPDAIPVDFVSGCGALIHRKVFETVGMFNPTFFMYGEDADLMWRIRRAGFRIIAVPNAVMWHKVSRSAGKDSPATRYWKTRNQIRFYRLHTRGAKRGLMFVLSTLRAVVFVVKDILLWRKQLLTPLYHGWADGWWHKENFAEVYQYGKSSV